MPLALRRGRQNLTITAFRKLPTAFAPCVDEKYDLHEIVGEGSFAVVRRAFLRGSSTDVAIKTIRSDDEEVLQQAQNEFELVSRLEHPNIMPVIEFIMDRDAARADLVMPFIHGLRLDQLVKRKGPLSEAAARPLFTQLMKAVHCCHSRRVCHRDIKPENIMVSGVDDGSFHLILMDFNASCVVGGLTPAGTRIYMSPEAWCAQVLYSEMTDLWSSGVCLYFMLAAYLPFVAHHLHVLGLEVSSFPLRLPSGLSAEAQSLLGGLLCRDVVGRLLVGGALAHPWCRLSEKEICDVFKLKSGSSAQFAPQPSYRDWEVKARKSSIGQNKCDGYPSFPRTATWPVLCGNGDQDTPTVVPTSPTSPERVSDWWISKLPLDGSHTTWRNVSLGWEIQARRAKLAEIYDPPPAEPLYRNWEVKARQHSREYQAIMRSLLL